MLLEYCSVNETLVSGRISQCLLVTVTSSISFGIVLILGTIEIVKFRLTKYYRYTRPLDLPLRLFVKIQIVLHLLVPLLTTVQCIVLMILASTQPGYVILAFLLDWLIWPGVIGVLLYRELSLNTRHHPRISLLLFWIWIFVSEMLTFLTATNQNSFFRLRNTEDPVYLSVFILRLILFGVILGIGIRGQIVGCKEESVTRGVYEELQGHNEGCSSVDTPSCSSYQ